MLFLATVAEGGVGRRRNEPKADQKIVVRSRVLRNNYLEGLFPIVQSPLSCYYLYPSVFYACYGGIAL